MLHNKKILYLLFIILSLILTFVYFQINSPSMNVILALRLPRFLLAFLVGFVLAGVGYAFQILLNNPLAEPYILGISSGAAFGSILAGIIGFYLLMPVFGFIGAILTMLIVWRLAHIDGFFNRTKLLLSGIIVGMFFSALISLLMYLNQKEIGNIVNVLLGNLGHIFSQNEWIIFLIVFFVSILLMIYLFSLSRKLIILATGDVIATSLGIEVKKLRTRIFIIASILTGITVAYAGIIGFVGLIIPHLVRMITGGNRRNGMFQAAIFGAFFLIFCDILAMNIATIEMPVGVITAFLGSPFFLLILVRSK